jgi:uncharacterized membrane protein (UPF0182 family)
LSSPKRLGYGSTLSQALDHLFSGEPSAEATPPGEGAVGEEEPGEEPGAAAGPPPELRTVGELSEQISTIYQEAEARRMAGDFAGYAEKVRELGPLIDDLMEQTGQKEPAP